LRFVVTDARSGSALEEFEVRLGTRFMRPLLDEHGKVARHFGAGRVQCSELFEAEAGTAFELLLQARGYLELRLSDLFVPRAGELDLGTLRMEPAPSLFLRVLDGSTGAPVAEALVSLDFERLPSGERLRPSPLAFDPFSARTDAQGWVRLTSRPGAEATLRIQSRDHAPYERDLALALSDEQRETIAIPVLLPSPPR
jgi:hypothetical protein